MEGSFFENFSITLCQIEQKFSHLRNKFKMKGLLIYQGEINSLRM
ncbi:hypothetical protein CSC35_4639 [Enterobacter hormaechei]|nr:hypothetical protein CSC35_4639 [Enterobacter hormaechei]